MRFEKWEVLVAVLCLGFVGYLFFRGLEFLFRHVHVTVGWQ